MLLDERERRTGRPDAEVDAEVDADDFPETDAEPEKEKGAGALLV
jgi:hypothetical protein